MAQLTLLSDYASKANPAEALLPAILFAHTDKTITIFDAYPKSIFHFLVLPRTSWCQDDPTLRLDKSKIVNLRTLLAAGKEKARKVLEEMKAAAEQCVREVEEEMIAMYGFKWDVWVGFHPVPSMPHIHLHIISADLCSRAMKTKKHYRSFHPKADFFLKLADVMEWFEATPSFFSMKAKLSSKEYAANLKGDLICFRCRNSFRNMPLLKAHLQEEFTALAAREKAKLERLKKLTAHKRKRAEGAAAGEASRTSQASTPSMATRVGEDEQSQSEKRSKEAGNA